MRTFIGRRRPRYQVSADKIDWKFLETLNAAPGRPERSQPKWWHYGSMKGHAPGRGVALGWQRGPWGMFGYQSTGLGARLGVERIHGVHFSVAAFGRGAIVGYMPTKPWRRPCRERQAQIGWER